MTIYYRYVHDICVIDQARGQDGWILANFFFYFFMYRDEVEVHDGLCHAKNIGDFYDISSPIPLGATNFEVGKKKVPLVELLNCNFYTHKGVSHEKTFGAEKTGKLT